MEEYENKSSSNPNTWLVIDARTAKSPNESSVSRFSYGLIQSVTKNLSEKKSNGSSRFSNFKILLI